MQASVIRATNDGPARPIRESRPAIPLLDQLLLKGPLLNGILLSSWLRRPYVDHPFLRRPLRQPLLDHPLLRRLLRQPYVDRRLCAERDRVADISLASSDSTAIIS